MPTTSSNSLADALFARLDNEIRDGSYRAGDRLPTEKVFAEREGVSRTVVREAIARLVAQGLVKPRQGTGLFVSEMVAYPPFQITPGELGDLEETLKLLELRMAVEAEMASLAALRRTEDDLTKMRDCLAAIEDNICAEAQVTADAAFHSAIARASGNHYFQRFVDFLGARLVPQRSVLLRGQPAKAYEAYARTLADEHRELFDAIADQDAVRARAAARKHMSVSIERHAGLTQEKSQ